MVRLTMTAAKTTTATATTTKKSFRRLGLVILAAFCIIFLAWTYCALAAPPQITQFTQHATLELAHLCGIHFFDPPANPATDGGPSRVTDLPEGCYIYTGMRPSQSAPRWVTVNPGGTITWLDVKAPQPQAFQPSAQTNNDSPASTTGTPHKGTAKAAAKGSSAAAFKTADNNFESYEYPMIKFQAKTLDGKGGIAQLWTTYDRPSPREEGVVKYRLTLFKAPGERTRRIQMLDQGGFKIFEFKASDFQDVPGTQLTESRDSFACPEDAYRQVRDYAIN